MKNGRTAKYFGMWQTQLRSQRASLNITGMFSSWSQKWYWHSWILESAWITKRTKLKTARKNTVEPAAPELLRKIHVSIMLRLLRSQGLNYLYNGWAKGNYFLQNIMPNLCRMPNPGESHPKLWRLHKWRHSLRTWVSDTARFTMEQPPW